MKQLTELNKKFGLDLRQRTRRRDVSWARFAAYKYLQDNGERIHDIGKVFFMDHSSVIYGIKAFNNALSVNDTIALEKWQRIQSSYEN